MKAGSTGYLRVELNVELDIIKDIIFTIKGKYETLHKNFPADVTVDGGCFLLPLNQHETTKLCGDVSVEAQINLIDGSVAKSEKKDFVIAGSIFTKYLDNAGMPTDSRFDIGDVQLHVDDILIVNAGGGTPVNAYTKAESDSRYAMKTDIPDLTGLASEEYVNEKIAGIDTLTDDDVEEIVKGYLDENPQNVPDETISEALSKYFNEHPVKGVTTEEIVDAVNLYLNANPDQFKGADGYTPVKGTDYFTEADKVEMVNAVIAALPTAESEEF